jgi:hypothetical protein
MQANQAMTTSPFQRRNILLFVAVAIVAFGFWWRWRTKTNSEQEPLALLKRAAGEAHYTKLVIAGDAVEKGIYDPSVAYTPDGRVGWLAYSSVKGNGNLIKGRLALGEYVHTHLARTTNGGANWIFVKVLNLSTNGTCARTDGRGLEGVWRYEVPSLVCDPTDPDTNHRWKLFVHRYFWERDRNSRMDYGWITLRTAADPAGEWSAELPLFGAGKNPLAPYHATCVDVNSLDASLKHNVAYTEPGALAQAGRLYLSMTALQPRLGLGGINVSYTIILLASDDHGSSWKFIGSLLKPQDATHFGYDYFDGTGLAKDSGRLFLLAVPGSRRGLMHDGCVAFEFESLAEGRLRRDGDGHPVVTSYFAPQPGILSGPGAGQATYDPANVQGGLIFPQFNLQSYPEVFQIFQTGRRLVQEK